MKEPIISIDVSNGSSDFQYFTQRGTKWERCIRFITQ